MSDTTMTPESGSGSLTVNEAAEKFASLMDTAEPSVEEQAEVVEQELEDSGVDESVEEESDIEQEESEVEEQEEPTYKVKIAGEEKTVTQSELIKLAQEGGDYTKKTQQLAEQRQALEREAQAIQESKQLRDAYAQRLQMVEQMLTQQQPQLDYEALEDLKVNDPIGYSVRVAEITQQREQLKAIQLERERIAEQQQAEYAQQIQNYVAQEAQKLAEILPEYTDPDKGEVLRKNLKSYAKELGFTDAELANVRDSRHVMALYKAMQYDQLQKSKPAMTKKVVEQQKTIKAGNATSGSTATENVKRDRQRLRESGRVADAARLYERFL